jgi:DtxR family Mn-dependent transcriptional regulator
MATSTVEDYLKAIYLAQDRDRDGIVSPGRISDALGVAPGTVTAMMKTLTESGLVLYEPYSGVRLTPAGGKLAAHVVRRHRLVELFLVRIMGMDWSEVHQDAEVLEHAVSDQLLERMDEMLGRPSADPHGDPIPSATGALPEVRLESLLSSPLDVRLRVARVTDQRSEFLRLLERHRLKPGLCVRVAARDPLAEMVIIQPEDGEPMQLGFQAAGRVLVESPAEEPEAG